jgi:hypothetical protein
VNSPIRKLLAVVGAALLAVTSWTVAPPARAATATFWVNGKTGADTNSGTSPAQAFKSVKAGLWALRYGGRLEVVGYNDYVYQETGTASQWLINGSAASPIFIEAAGYGTSGYVRPIVSGSTVVNRPGSRRWTRPDPVNAPNVWATPWTAAIPGYESAVTANRQERVFVDISQPLVRPVTAPTLAQLQAAPGSEYWNGRTLYVRLGGWGAPAGAPASLDPNDHQVDIPTYAGLLIGSGSNYVTVQGFRIRHATMGVGFTGTASHNVAQDIDASDNYGMGFWTGSSYNTFRRVTGSRNTIQLIKLDNGANHTLVEYATGTQNLGQGIKLTGASNAYNTVRYSTFRGGRDVPVAAAAYGGYVQGIDIEEGAHDNVIQSNVVDGNRRGLMLYQVTSSGKPLSSNMVRYNTFRNNDTAIVLWDGKFSATNGAGSVYFTRNTYVGNTVAVASEAATSHKTFDHETFYRTGSAATLANSTFYLKAGTVTLRNSIVSYSSGYAFYVKSGAKLAVTYTTTYLCTLGIRNSSLTTTLGTGWRRTNPGFLSTIEGNPDFLYIGPTSGVYTVSSTGGPIGARWR